MLFVFILCYILITLLIDIMKHISIVVLQDVENEVKAEESDCKDIDIEHGKMPTFHFVASFKEEKVRNL